MLVQEKVLKREVSLWRGQSPMDYVKKKLVPPRMSNSSAGSLDHKGKLDFEKHPEAISVQEIERQLQRLNNSVKLEEANMLESFTQAINTILRQKFHCQSCQENLETIETLKKDLKNQKHQVVKEMQKTLSVKNNLQTYENLLRQRESSLEFIRNQLDNEQNEINQIKYDLSEDRKKIEAERNEIEIEKEKIDQEKFKLNHQLKKLDDKYLGLYRQYSPDLYDENKFKKINDFRPETDTKLEVYNNHLLELQKKEKELKDSFYELKQFKEKLSKKEESLGLLENKLLSQKNDLKNKLKILETELGNLEHLKKTLKKETHKKTDSNSSETQNEKIKTCIEWLKDKESLLEFKEKTTESLKSDLEKREKSLAQKENHLKNFINIIETLERYKMLSEDLITVLNTKEIQFQNKCRESVIAEELNQKILKNEIKEQELIEMQHLISKEKEDIETTTDLLQRIQAELESQKAEIAVKTKMIDQEKSTF
jgi:DNA repair exonuclease SbcCD ATPase subunit